MVTKTKLDRNKPETKNYMTTQLNKHKKYNNKPDTHTEPVHLFYWPRHLIDAMLFFCRGNAIF